MLAALALIFLVLWVLGVVVFHVTAFFIHILLVIALVSLVLHFVNGRGTSA